MKSIFSALNRLTLGVKITLLAVCPVIILLLASLTTLLIEQRQLDDAVTGSIRRQADGEASKIARNVYLLCEATEARNQHELAHTLGLAREAVEKAGGVNLDTATVAWKAVNQLTQGVEEVTLPRMRVGPT